MSEKPSFVKVSGDVKTLTPAGEEAIAPLVTSVYENVYAFTSEADQVTVAAGMARLSRTVNELRPTIAGEFLQHDGKEDELINRVVTEYGDDSVAQLIMLQVGNEDVSNVAVKLIEDGRYGSYLERSSRYVDYSKKDSLGRYRYYRPAEFDNETNETYLNVMDSLFETYKEIYDDMKKFYKQTTQAPESRLPNEMQAWDRACHAQACDIARYVLPLATSTTVGVVGSAQFFANNISRLTASELPEAQQIAKSSLHAVRQVAPAFFERVDMPERGGLITDHRAQIYKNMGTLSMELLGVTKPVKSEDVRLNWHSPQDEDVVLAAILFPHSNLPQNELLQKVKKMPTENKEKIWETYVGERYNRRAKAGRAFEVPHYSFDINSDIGAFRDIHRHRVVDNPERQKFTPEHGYIIPPAVKNAGPEVLRKYRKAFTQSEILHGILMDKNYTEQAQYAVLFGHRILFTQTMNGREAMHSIELRTTPQGHPSYRAKYQRMGELITSVHPHVGKAMKFMSQAEDAELARMGAELAAARKTVKI